MSLEDHFTSSDVSMDNRLMKSFENSFYYFETDVLDEMYDYFWELRFQNNVVDF